MKIITNCPWQVNVMLIILQRLSSPDDDNLTQMIIMLVCALHNVQVMWRTFETRLLSRLGRLTRARTDQVKP